MSLTFSFALGQNQTFELRYQNRTRPLPLPELTELVDWSEASYYSVRNVDEPTQLVAVGRTLYHWLDGSDGWLRGALANGEPLDICLDLVQTMEVEALNPETQRVALGLAHLPWELLHDGQGFLLGRQDVDVSLARQVQRRNSAVAGAQNRPLRLLFMATEPEAPGIVSLSYEQEEANILTAIQTQRQTLDFVPEESGSVDELGSLVQSYAADHFDVFHLTGHGVIYTRDRYGELATVSGRPMPDHTPCFVTEDELGQLLLAAVPDLAKAFRNRWPRVIFLSGCHTGQVANQGTVPSMAAELVRLGASVVLGWARPVFDDTAIVAATALYRALAAGETVAAAVQAAQQEMLGQHLANPQFCPDWHLLRMYRDTRPVKSLVTPLRTPKREKLQPVKAEDEFLDDQKQIKVASRYEFVGRRRPLQACLRAMTETSDQVGVYIYGMGGLGKSTLAARVCNRVESQRPEFQQAVLVGPLDEIGLLNLLSRKYERYPEIPALLNQPKVTLKGRLQNFFEAIEQLGQPLLLVLDDFEQNIPVSNVQDGSLRLALSAYEALDAVTTALVDNQAISRLIVTCRYHQPGELPTNCQRLHTESLQRMSATAIEKKCRLLPTEELRNQSQEQQVLDIADGNPRLLEWLTEVLAEKVLDEAKLLDKLTATAAGFREDVLAQELLQVLTETEQQFLAQASAVWLPVEVALLPKVAERESVLSRLTGLGLIERSKDSYRVSRILEPILQPVLSEAAWKMSYRAAVQRLYEAWWEAADRSSEAQRLEMVRLGLLADEQEITVVVGDALAVSWYGQARFTESLELCQYILKTFEDYRILGSIARAETIIGDTQAALEHYGQALNLCSSDDLKEKATTLSNMAQVIAQQGDIDRALSLWQESMEIQERIGDVKGRAATLNNMAYVIAQQGDIDRALSLWQESMEIKERIGDVKGRAATLANLAYWAGETGDKPRQLALNLESAQALGQVRAYGDLLTVLSNLGFTAEQGGEGYLAQAIWLLLRLQTPLTTSVTLLNALYQRVPKGDPLEALLGTTAFFFCQTQGKDHPQQQALAEASIKILAGAAAEQGVSVETMESLQAWMAEQQLNDPGTFLPRLTTALEALIADSWAFDRTPLLENS